MSDIFYKIRHKKTGNYSKGGAYVNAEGNNSFWVEKGGKTWDTLGKLRAHISSHLNRYYGATDMTDWQIIEYHSVVKEVKDVHEIVTPDKIMKILKQ